MQAEEVLCLKPRLSTQRNRLQPHRHNFCPLCRVKYADAEDFVKNHLAMNMMEILWTRGTGCGSFIYDDCSGFCFESLQQRRKCNLLSRSIAAVREVDLGAQKRFQIGIRIITDLKQLRDSIPLRIHAPIA